MSNAFPQEERARQYAMLTEEEKSMPIDAPLTDDLDLSNTDMASMDQPIPGSNIGFRMLQKLGWKAGSGLGRRQQGIIDPIRFDVKEEVLGVGAESHYREMSKMTTSERKRLESESQLNETPEQAAVREAKAEQRRRQDQNVQDELSNLRCTLCNKQYTKAIEYQAHLDSYDHNHRKVRCIVTTLLWPLPLSGALSVEVCRHAPGPSCRVGGDVCGGG